MQSFKKSRERFEVEWRPPPAKAAKTSKQNQERQNKGKKRAAGSASDDPIESFPDELRAIGSSSGQASLRSSEGASFPPSMLQLYEKLDNLRNQVCTILMAHEILDNMLSKIMTETGLRVKSKVISEALIQDLCFNCPRGELNIPKIVVLINHTSV